MAEPRYRLILGPAQFGQGAIKTREWKADNVEVAAFDARNEAAGVALDGIRAGFVVRLARGEIAGDLFGRESRKVDESRLHESAALRVRKSDQSHSGDNGVGSAGKFFEHAARVIAGTRLAENVAIERDNGVRTDDDRRADSSSGRKFGLGGSKTLDQVVRRFVLVGSFIDSGRKHNERQAGITKDFGAPSGRGSKD